MPLFLIRHWHLAARARKPRVTLSYSRGIGRTYDGPSPAVKLGRSANFRKRAFQQSQSFAGVHPVGQQASPAAATQLVIGTWRQVTLQLAASPVSCSAVHGSPSSGQVVGQVLGGSQVSPAPIRPSAQLGAQSRSLAPEQPGGQQPSPARQAVTVWWVQVRVQPSAEPETISTVQALASSQVLRQAPWWPAVIARSQFSSLSTTPLPQIGWQSLSLAVEQPGGQQLSPFAHPTIGIATQAALQVPPPRRT